MATIPTRHEYKIFRNNTYLGMLSNVTSDFEYSQSLYTAAAALTVAVAQSPDISNIAVEALQTETPANLETEGLEVITTERAPDAVGNIDGVLIRNNNNIEVWEISDTYPNGLLVYSGYISRWSAKFGGDDDIEISCLNHGTELDNYLIQGSSTLDQSQASTDLTLTMYDQLGGMFDSWIRHGQVWTVGTGVTNLSAILIRLHVNTPGDEYIVTVKVWNNASEFNTGTVSPLATVIQYVSATTATNYTFTLTTPLTVSVGQQYFFSVQASNGTVYGGTGVQISIYQSDGYANGGLWNSTYGGGGGGGWGAVSPANDMLFQTYWTGGATNSPFLNKDPGQIAVDIMQSYINRGGRVTYTTSSIWATLTQVDYTFSVNTVLEGIKKCVDLSPANWYWFVDVATNTVYFREAATTAEHTFILGRQIESLDLLATIEPVINQIYFTGGKVGADNLYLSRSDATALAANNGRVGLARITDNRVTLNDTAVTIIDSRLDDDSAESYQTMITIHAAEYNITTLSLGQVVGFAGFGTWVDNLILQIVTIQRQPDSITLTLGKIPKRQSAQVEQIERQLREVQTVDNPDVPS